MTVQELIDRLAYFDPKMEIKIHPKGWSQPTEVISDVAISEHPCPNICVLIKGN